MPPTRQMLEKAIRCLDQTTLRSFTALPATILPGQSATLNWHVTTPRGCAPQFFLHNSAVSKNGSRVVQPVVTTTYALVARMHTISQTLGMITVNVDTTGCPIVNIDESEVAEELNKTIATTLSEFAPIRTPGITIQGVPVRQLFPPTVEIDRAGISVVIRLQLLIPDFFDPRLTVNMLITVGVVDHQPAISYRRFSADLTWDTFLATIIPPAITHYVNETIEGLIEQRLKPRILKKLKERLDARLAIFANSLRLETLTTDLNEIRVMACPLRR